MMEAVVTVIWKCRWTVYFWAFLVCTDHPLFRCFHYPV